MKALSIQQPWAWAIIHAGKDIENRSWVTGVRGRILIHAGKKLDHDGVGFMRNRGIILPSMFDIGGIVGSVEIAGCVISSPSKWFFGPFGFVLLDSRPLPFMAVRGQLGFFDVDYPSHIVDIATK